MEDRPHSQVTLQRQMHLLFTLLLQHSTETQTRQSGVVEADGDYLMAASKPSSTDLAAKALGAVSIAACKAFRIASPLTCHQSNVIVPSAIVQSSGKQGDARVKVRSWCGNGQVSV